MNTRDKLNPAIYSITNTLNNKRYIGSATRLKERWRVHKYLLRKNKHFNNHLQNAWNKYGEENFKFESIELISNYNIEKLTSILIEREEYFIIYYNANNNKFGYNSRIKCNSNLGHKMSEEQKKKLSIVKMGKYTEAQRQSRIEYGLKRRGIPNTEISNWWKNLSKIEKENLINRRVNTLKEINKYKKENFGSIFTDESIKKIQNTRIKRGTSKIVQAYNLDGSFYKKYNSYSEALRDFDVNTKNGASIFCSIKNGYLFKDKMWKIGNSMMNENEYNIFKEKSNSLKSNLKYKRMSITGEILIFNTKIKCANSINVSNKDRKFNESFLNGNLFKGYHWQIIEPITGNSIYDNGVKTGNSERIPSEI